MSTINTAISGLKAAETRINTSASNTANQLSTYGEDDAGKPANIPYEARQTQNISQQPGGVQAINLLSDPATVQIYDPASAVADSEGLVNSPNVSQEGEALSRLLASQAYKANLSVIETDKETTQSLLNSVA